MTVVAPEGAQQSAPTKYPIIWVKPSSSVPATASMLISSIEEDQRITLRAIGAGAVNQALKAAIHARQILAGRGLDLIIKPGFTTVEGNDGNDVTAIVLHCLLL